MERSERLRLEKIRRDLRKDLASIDSLIATASSPKRLSRIEIRKRATKICRAVHAHGGTVSHDQLREITGRHGLAFGAVGALFGGGYLRRRGKEITLGKRGLDVMAAGKKRHRRTQGSAKGRT